MTEYKKVCLFQFLPRGEKVPKNMRKPGTGDCSTCTTDEKNKYCTSYTPITIMTTEVKQ